MKKGIATIILYTLGMNTSFAQIDSKPYFFVNYKTHQFYDPGVYNIGEVNKATGSGVGISIYKDLNKRLSLSGGYGYALIDSLAYGNDFTSNAAYHQIEANLALTLFRTKRFNPNIFFGYAYNHISQLKEFKEPTFGMNINFGTGTEIKITNKIGLGYGLTYNFSLAENLRYNFRHQFGLVYHPSGKSTTVVKEVEEKEDRTALEAELAALKSENKALKVILEPTEDQEGENTQPEINSLIVSYNSELNAKIAQLELDNQRLLEELRTKRFVNDSLLITDFNGYTFINQKGQVIKMESSKLDKGYYLAYVGITTLEDVKKVYKNQNFSNLDTKYILNRYEGFLVVGYVSDNERDAMKIYRDLDENQYYYRVLRF
jgi:hypothetical protein